VPRFLLAALLALAPATALAVPIDGFGTFAGIAPGGPIVAGPAPDVIGGQRFYAFQPLDGGGGSTLAVNAGDSGYLELRADPDIAVTLVLFWGQPTTPELLYNGLKADLTGGGVADRFRIRSRASTSPAAQVEVFVPPGLSSQLPFSLDSGPLTGGFSATDVFFSSFIEVPGAFSIDDLENVGSLSLTLTVAAGTVLQIDSIETIPEPAPLATLCAALLLLLGLRRSMDSSPRGRLP
jgi:hypothetical protein